MVTGDRQMIASGLNYNYWKVLYFISTDYSWSKKSGITYLSNFPDQFYNVVIHPVGFPLLVYKLFGSVNEVDSHSKSI